MPGRPAPCFVVRWCDSHCQVKRPLVTLPAREGGPMPEPRLKTPPALKEVHVVWITAGLGCDGDTVSITAATQPSVEDLVTGAIPGIPRVLLHNPVLAYENGDE